ncbi:hypothetical protein [Deinococcus sp. 14RED07]|nr:hypothetical protein [Deinococcus sp. 14RED07]
MSGPLLLALTLIAVYWLARVGRAARVWGEVQRGVAVLLAA